MINPLAGYSKEPAPMGIADFGVTGAKSGQIAYSYASSAFEGIARVNSMDVAILSHGSTEKVTAFELNAVLVLRLGGVNYTYWIQNGLHVDAASKMFTIGGAYVWNFTSPSAHLSSSEVRGNASSVLVSDTYYFIPGCGVFAGQCSSVSWPDTLTGRVLTSSSGGIPFVDFQYNLGSGWVTYDNVSFLHMTGASDFGFVVDGYRATPVASSVFYDAEWVWVAAGGGLTSVVKTSDLQMSLEFWNGRNFQAVPNAWDFGGDTGETSSNVTETAGETGATGAPTAVVTNGGGSLGILYNQTKVGFLNLSVPASTPQVLYLNGTPVPIQNGSVNLTLAAGSYLVSLQNYSNSSEIILVSPGATTYVNLSGAGRVAFEASGLSVGTSWGISLDGELRTSTASNIVFNLPNGTYAINYSKVPGFYRNGSDPTKVTLPVNAPIAVDWSPFAFNVSVSESGLPDGTPWWLSVGGILEQGNGATLDVFAPNGSTPFVAGSAYEFVASPSQGWINITRGVFAPVEIAFSYRATYIDGTVDPSDATVTINAVPQALTGGAFNASVIPGSYTVTASATGYATQTLQANATAGNVTVERIVLLALPGPMGATPSSPGPSNLPVEELVVGFAIAGVSIAVVLFLMFRRGPAGR
jgi:hypothetical protein